MKARRSVRRAILAALLTGLLLPALIIGALGAHSLYQDAVDRTVKESLANYGDTLALGLSEPLWAFDRETASALAAAIAQAREVSRIEVQDARMGRFVLIDEPARHTGRSFMTERAILHQGVRIGSVRVEVSDLRAVEAVGRRLRVLALTLLAQTLVAGLLIAWVLDRRLVRPLRRLGTHADAIARGELGTPIAAAHVDEIGELGDRLDATRQSLRAALEHQALQQRQLEHDLAQRRRAELAASQSEQQLRAIVEQSPIAILEISLEGVVQSWNGAAERIFGWPREMAHGKHVRELMEEDGPQALADIFRVVRREAGGWRHVAESRTRAGRAITCQWHMNLLRDERSVPDRILAMVEDISQRRQAEEAQQQMVEALRASEERFSLAFREAPVAMSLVNAQSFIVQDVNLAMVALLGYAREEIVDRDPGDLRLGVDPARNKDLRTRLLDRAEVSDYDYVLKAKQGHQVHVRFWARLIPHNDPPLALHIMIDVTERVRVAQELAELNRTLEARVTERTHELQDMLGQLHRTRDELIQSEKLAALGGLVAGVAHEMNTPIGNALLVASTLRDASHELARRTREGLKRSTLDEFVREADTATDILLRNLDRAGELISSFKQIAVDQTSSQRRNFHLDELANEIIVTLQPSFRKTPFTVANRVPAGLAFDSFPGPLGQVLTNLVNNAVLHGFEHRAQGSVEIRARGLDAELVEIEVADDGQGIPAEHLRKIFDPFFTTKRGNQGSGLGLHIVHNIVTGLLGGQVSVDSGPQGTTMRIVLPRRAPQSPEGGTAAQALG
ncbi:PAS domain-containing sensor histidine kinase [Niveibacterium sp. SC-1]|uniref:PAS domain-containing sensor histidine kinase n=1 Tax=Niveibacterium sp. SC-1 TaxID=3135646 RepID=UPI00311DD15B